MNYYFGSDGVEESSKIKSSVFTLLCQVDKIELKSCHFLKQFHIVSVTEQFSMRFKMLEDKTLSYAVFHLLSYSTEYAARNRKKSTN